MKPGEHSIIRRMFKKTGVGRTGGGGQGRGKNDLRPTRGCGKKRIAPQTCETGEGGAIEKKKKKKNKEHGKRQSFGERSKREKRSRSPAGTKKSGGGSVGTDVKKGGIPGPKKKRRGRARDLKKEKKAGPNPRLNNAVGW